MRELLARILATLTALAVVCLAAGFSLVQNLPLRGETQRLPARPAVAGTEVERFAAGRAAFDRNGCAGCHSIGGHGNPRSPLDGVGGKLDRDSIRDWIIASDRVRERLSPGAVRIKQSYAALPDHELRDLVDLLEGQGARSDVPKR